MGNAGDLLKHGVLVEFVRWRLERDTTVRFLDLFAGEPFARVAPETVERVKGLAGGALAEAQTEIGKCRYFGSSKLVRNLGQRHDRSNVCVFVNDCDPERLDKLCACCMRPLNEAFPDDFDHSCNDAYAAFEKIAHGAKEGDVVLIDPFGEFIRYKTKTVIPQMEKMANSAAVVLFALNLQPDNRFGRCFDGLLNKHLKGAWRMTCPPLRGTDIKGESRYYAEVVLAAHDLRGDCPKVTELRTRLKEFTCKLAKVLCLCDDGARMLMPRTVGEGDGP